MFNGQRGSMTRHAALSFTPRLMAAPVAAAYLAISESTLRTLGLPRRVLGGKRLYDVATLDDYVSSLPFEGQEGEANSCDGKFGTAR